MSLISKFIRQDSALQKQSCSVMCTQTFMATCVTWSTHRTFEPWNAVFLTLGPPFQYFSEPKNDSWWLCTENKLILWWVSTLDSALKPISMCLYHPLDNDYSYNTWFKSTLHSLVNYAQHSESIYFPIYTELFFLFLFLQHNLGAEYSFWFTDLFSISISLLFCFFLALEASIIKNHSVQTQSHAALLLFLYLLSVLWLKLVKKELDTKP